MDIDVYRNFLVVVSCGTISEAARKLNMTQPALSMQIKNLQNNLGQELLTKHQGTHRLELTSAGRMVHKRALELCNLEDTIFSELKQSKDGIRGMVNIGVFSWDDEIVLGNLIPAFHKEYPLVKFNITRNSTEVNNSQCDLRIIRLKDLPEHKSKYDVIYMENIHPYVVVNKDNLWLGKDVDKLYPEMLDGIPLACRNSEIGMSLINLIKHNGSETDVLIWANFRRGIIKSAESGMVAGLLLGNNDEGEYPKLKFIPLIDKNVDYCCLISKPKGMKLTPLLQRFLDFSVEYHNKR